MYDDIKNTERFLAARKKLAVRLIDTIERVNDQMDNGAMVDSFTVDLLLRIQGFASEVLLKEPSGRNN